MENIIDSYFPNTLFFFYVVSGCFFRQYINRHHRWRKVTKNKNPKKKEKSVVKKTEILLLH